MKRKFKWGAAAAVTIGIALTVFLYTQSRPPASPGIGYPGELSEIRMTVTKEDITKTLEIKGKSSYVNETNVIAPFTADVIVWHVEEGQSVKAGQPLFELEAGALQRELALAEARIRQQELELRLSLMPQDEKEPGGDPGPQTALGRYADQERQELARQLRTLELETARAELADKQDRLQKRIMTAPKDGIFLFADRQQPLNVEQDKLVGTIVDMTELQLVSEVSEFEVFRIKEGMDVEVKINPLPDEKLQGRIVHVSKFAKTGTGSSGSAAFEVIVRLERHPALIAGLSLTGKIVTDSREGAIVVPTIAVMRENDSHYVYVDENGETVRREIRIGLENADKTEVLEGLNEGDTVVLR